jgi:hypothetical protein
MKDAPLTRALVQAFWRELDARYRPENVRRFPELHAIPLERIDRLRTFFLDYIYPPADRRPERDQAFLHFGAFLRSPRKLWPLLGQAASSVFKLGRMLGAALKAAYHTLEAYNESERLEAFMLETAEKFGYRPESFENPEAVRDLVRLIPERRIARFQAELIALFDTLANVKLLKTTLEIMEGSLKVMQAQANLYSEAEFRGLNYGYGILKAGHDLFLEMGESQAALVLRGIALVERDWLENVMRRTPATQNPGPIADAPLSSQ